jgi:hypothetical protein
MGLSVREKLPQPSLKRGKLAEDRGDQRQQIIDGLTGNPHTAGTDKLESPTTGSFERGGLAAKKPTHASFGCQAGWGCLQGSGWQKS